MAIEYVYMPNEIFDDMKHNIPNSSQSAFAYSYIYYITYLYRYCKCIDSNGNKVTQEIIKEFLGYSPKNKKIDFIIKKGGILDNINYTLTTTDYPIQFLYDDENLIYFETINNYKNMINNNNRNFKVKFPVKSFYRTNDDFQEKSLTGTFFEVEDTHKINYNTFRKIITDNDLGTSGFFVYGYLKHKNNIFKTGYQRSTINIGKELNFSDNTIRKYINILESKGFLRVERKIFDMRLSQDEFEANIYNVLL